MVTADEVIQFYTYFEKNGIRVWLNGGWGIDALLGESTRSHKDLDIFVLVDDITRLNQLLAKDGYQLSKTWSENLSAVDSAGHAIETGYVLRDPLGHELDVHAFRFDAQGNGIPAWQVEDGFILSVEDLSGAGSIHGFQVRCQSAENQMLCHRGYVIPDHQWPDLDALHEKLGVEFPADIASQRLTRSAAL